MENSDDDPFSFYQFQEDDIDIACPDITTWDDVINRIPYLTPENVQAVDFRDHHRVDRKGKQPKKSTEDTSHVAQKKLMHRDIEKLRRKEMATLYADLRSVVPARFLKGKRSVSDQIHEAKTYIECLQRDVRALGAKRDDIKVMSTKDDQGAGRCSSSMASNFSVSVEPCSVGVEVVISGELMMLADGRQLALPVSRVLKLMSEEGLAVVCCNWTNSDGRLHYVIQSVSDQIHEAKTYIECLQRDVRALGAKRDDIKVMSTKDDQGAGRCSSSMASNFSVSVEPCSVGVEVVISGELMMLADGRQLALPVSRVLKLMSEEGLAVVCCNWTNSDGRLHYVIQSEVLGYVDVDFPTLQRKLYGMINGLIDIKRT